MTLTRLHCLFPNHVPCPIPTCSRRLCCTLQMMYYECCIQPAALYQAQTCTCRSTGCGLGHSVPERKRQPTGQLSLHADVLKKGRAPVHTASSLLSSLGRARVPRRRRRCRARARSLSPVAVRVLCSIPRLRLPFFLRARPSPPPCSSRCASSYSTGYATSSAFREDVDLQFSVEGCSTFPLEDCQVISLPSALCLDLSTSLILCCACSPCLPLGASALRSPLSALYASSFTK